MKTEDKPELTPLEVADCKTGRQLGPLRRAKGVNSRKRIKIEKDAACYHVMSRTAGGEFLFDDQAKEAFRKMMWRMAAFAGVEILTYCVMSNHFHILVKVPEREKWFQRFEGEDGEEKLLKHLSLVYSKTFMSQLHRELDTLRSYQDEQGEAGAQQILQGFKDRLCDISKFLKELKERFSRWYNKHYGRRGTLWMDRFKSVLVEGPGRAGDPMDVLNAALMMANYIDLNPVRAGICDDPKDYRWCGYAEALGGSKRARRGLCKVMNLPMDDWEKSTRGRVPGRETYRMLVFENAVELQAKVGGDSKSRKGISQDKAESELARDGQLSRSELLRCRIKYFSEGLVIGGQGFVSGLGTREDTKDIR